MIMKKFFFIFLIVLLAGCKSLERTRTEVRTDTCLVERVRTDSVYVELLVRDSVNVRVSGDTVLIERWHTRWRDRWRERVVLDSIYVAQRDTVRVVEVREVALRLSWWQRLRLGLGSAVLLGLVGLVGWRLRRFLH